MRSNYHTIGSSDFDMDPEVSPHLLTHLKRVYPDKLPSDLLKKTDRELGVLIGQQNIINHLEGMLDNQIEKD